MKSVISSIERSLGEAGCLAVAAAPGLRAIALTSTSSTDERRETLRAGPPSRGGSRMSADTSEPSTERSTSMMPSETGSSRRPPRSRRAGDGRRRSRRPRARARGRAPARGASASRTARSRTPPGRRGGRPRPPRPAPAASRGRAFGASVACVLEAAVRDEDVERLGQVGRALHPELAEDVGEHLPGGRGLGHDQVHVAEPRVRRGGGRR